ncbi:hypothetical protein PRUB_b0323 [Pseudoalteromonas rubra]|uniref:Uncharacterized protein n=1 Tax=Pseudoalteromonas rubra TaxID=43658 RepID=A0A8T0C1Q5_9GAMM|nr:hypothetical protein PRUB_b0323 [Pseudoalteromonas rubra]
MGRIKNAEPECLQKLHAGVCVKIALKTTFFLSIFLIFITIPDIK